MRLPKIRQLTEEQKNVYLYAPTDRHILVQGPPGTGKTLIACLRALELQKRQVPVMLGMFSRVLARYSSSATDGTELPSQTVMTWFREWWGRSGLPPHIGTPGIVIQAPFEQNPRIKAAGGRFNAAKWRPWGRGYGAWCVDTDIYFSGPEAFAEWILWHEPPAPAGKPAGIDWEAAAKHVLEFEHLIPDTALAVGTLLIDEGQDFAPGFYRMLRQLSAVAAARGARIRHPLRCFVLADENQQITEENSTLDEIAGGLRIAPENRYVLLDNFRNSKEIAELARAFFADVGVLPRLPLRSSEKPVFSLAASHADVARRILIWITNNPGKEVAVLVFDDASRESMMRAVKDSLSVLPGRTIVVQTYSWKTRAETRVDDLVFDQPDVVTVLNMQSCKGLEFDAVFIVDLHKAQIGIYGPDRFRMQMFVAVSRGREWVSLMDTGRSAGSGPYVTHLPGPDVLERESGSSPLPVDGPGTHGRRSEQVPVQAGEETWHATLLMLAKTMQLRVNDKRAVGGALWVNAGRELAGVLEPLGLVYSEKRLGWWKK